MLPPIDRRPRTDDMLEELPENIWSAYWLKGRLPVSSFSKQPKSSSSSMARASLRTWRSFCSCSRLSCGFLPACGIDGLEREGSSVGGTNIEALGREKWMDRSWTEEVVFMVEKGKEMAEWKLRQGFCCLHRRWLRFCVSPALEIRTPRQQQHPEQTPLTFHRKSLSEDRIVNSHYRKHNGCLAHGRNLWNTVVVGLFGTLLAYQTVLKKFW